MSDLIIHHSIADLYRALGMPIEQEMDFTIHFLPAIHTEIPFKSPLFRANYYSFVFVKDGHGHYITDNEVYPTAPGTVYFTNPGHIKGFEMNELKDAYIITLTEAFLKANVHPDIFEEFPFLLAERVPPCTLVPEEFAAFESLYMQIWKEYHGDSAYKNKILGNLFVVLLLKIKERFWKGYNPIDEGDRSSQIVKQFKQSMERHFRSLIEGQMDYHYQVQDYANEQRLHPNYLSHVIKSKTGKSVNQWMVEKLIGEARAMLRNSQMTAKEIGYRLGFSEPTHFNSYFKKHTGQTPGAYRKAQKP